MQKKQLLHILAVIIIIAGIVVTIMGVMKYRMETKLQQPVLEEYRWDNDANLQKGDIVIESDTESEVKDSE